MDWFSKFFSKINSNGIPVPTVRDPKTGQGSITASVVVVSAGLCSVCIVMTLLSALSKLAGVFDKFSESQQAFINAFNLSFQFFLASGSFYLGRKMQRDPKGQLGIDVKKDDNNEVLQP